MSNLKENFEKKLGKVVELTIKIQEHPGLNATTYQYEGVILPKYSPKSESFISDEKYIICDLISGNKTPFRVNNITDIKIKRCSKEIKSIVSEIYKLAKEEIKIKKQLHLLEQRKNDNKSSFLSSLDKIKEIEGAMDFQEFSQLIEEYLIKSVRNCKYVENDYGFKTLQIDDYAIRLFGGEYDDYDGLYLIQIEKSIDIEKYAHTSGYSFIHGGNSYYDSSDAYIDTEDSNYKAMLKQYERKNIKLNYNNLNARVENKSFFDIEEKGWLSYHHKIDIVFKEEVLPRKNNISKIVEIFTNK